MKATIFAALAALTLVAGTALAQGWHDERPHAAPPVAAEEKLIVEPRVHPGGRHDAQSHKSAIAAHNRALAKKNAAEAARQAEAAAQLDKAKAK